MVKRALITLSGDDDQQFRVQQAEAFEDDIFDLEILFPYGMSANLPPNSLLTVFRVGNDENYRVAIGDAPDDRIKNLEEGEVVFFHPGTKSFIHFKANGDIDIDASEATGNVNINVNQANINAADSVNIDSPITNLGVSGEQIARKGDPVSVTVVGGSSAGVHTGIITDGGVNTSI